MRTYWFEVFDMFRRFLVTGLPKVLSSMGIHTIQIYIGLAVMAICPVMYSSLDPYENNTDHRLSSPSCNLRHIRPFHVSNRHGDSALPNFLTRFR